VQPLLFVVVDVVVLAPVVDVVVSVLPTLQPLVASAANKVALNANRLSQAMMSIPFNSCSATAYFDFFKRHLEVSINRC
jgi:hypothetical protein